ncbi:PREDICTED: neuroparsin-A-like isoform X2 [Ceratosolen solmsi marchali]|uniref:Neuroparsin-A-like isoform X2 n=1 Tax=Ceratosolen solmsi marchali TaxID=326594 RepID=A0AAJ6YTZ0_9HYME|nr:PREDICTED: neuroparsin-A-like isoform X2 [Ceratosolen solmsi marchali]
MPGHVAHRDLARPLADPPRDEMRASHTDCALVLLLLLGILPLFLGHPTIIERGEQRSECEGCADECEKCKYGFAFSNWCGLKECLKGPGEMCGGVRNKYGACGEGMYCRCNKCTGCSIDTLECFSGFCPIYEQMQLRHPEHMQGLQLDK